MNESKKKKCMKTDKATLFTLALAVSTFHWLPVTNSGKQHCKIGWSKIPTYYWYHPIYYTHHLSDSVQIL